MRNIFFTKMDNYIYCMYCESQSFIIDRINGICLTCCKKEFDFNLIKYLLNDYFNVFGKNIHGDHLERIINEDVEFTRLTSHRYNEINYEDERVSFDIIFNEEPEPVIDYFDGLSIEPEIDIEYEIARCA